MTAKIRVLLITRNFPPLVGGMEHLICNCALQLGTHFDTTVVGPPGGDVFVNNQLTYVPARVKKPVFFSLISIFLHALLRSIIKPPRVVLCGSGLMAPIGYLCARLTKAKCIVYLHGLDIVVDNWVYQSFFMPFIRRFDLVIANSDSSFQSAVDRRIPESKLTILYPGTDVPGYHPDRAVDFRIKHGLNDYPTLLYIGRITRRKGLLEFVQNCALTLIKSFPELRILVVGDDAAQSLTASDPIIAKLRKYIEQNSLERHFIFYGETTDRSIVSQAYWSAHLMVFPVHHIPNDTEGFGMVAIEAAAHGIPTVAFRVGGLVNSVREGRSGALVDYPDYPAFAEAVVNIMEKRTVFEPCECIDHGQKYSWQQFGEELRAKVVEVAGM